jgi:hypothetical protein
MKMYDSGDRMVPKANLYVEERVERGEGGDAHDEPTHSNVLRGMAMLALSTRLEI